MSTINKKLWLPLSGQVIKWIYIISYSAILLQITACGGGGGGGDTQAQEELDPPTAILDVSDAVGKPLVGGSINYGEDFILSAKRSSDATGDIVMSYRWTALTSSGGGLTVGKPVETDSATFVVAASNTAVPLGVQEYELVVTDYYEKVSKPVRVQVIVRDPLPPTAILDIADGAGQALTNNSIAHGQDFMLSAKRSSDTGGGTIAKYHWTAVTAPVGIFAGGSGSLITDTDSLMINASTDAVPVGTQSYRLVVEDNSGNLSSADDVQLVIFAVNQAPAAVISMNPGSGFAPLQVTFDASASSDNDGSIVDYAWDFGDGSTANGVTASHRFDTAGSYTVTLVVTDDDAATEAAKAIVEVLPAPAVSITPVSVTLSPNETQQFTATVTGTSNTGVSWSLDDTACGSIDGNGLFSAGNPAAICSNTVRATSLADNRVSAVAKVIIATCSNAEYSVNSTADVADASPGDMLCDDGSGNCTLRAAIEEANACLGPNRVSIPADTYVLTRGQLAITDEVTVSGAGMKATIIDGNAASRIFSVASNLGPVTIQDLTIQNGQASSAGGVAVGSNTPTLMQRVALKNNFANQYSGGAVHMAPDSELTVVDAVISGNRMTGLGGSVALIYQGAHLTLRNSTVTNNGPSGYGVILDWADGSAPVTVDIENSTIAGNDGPALFANSSNVMTITNSTITNNGEGIRAGAGHGASTITISNSILYGNGSNCVLKGGTITSGGHNIDSRDSCGFTASGDLVNTNPKLGALLDNGGPTPTRGLLAGSPALNAGDNTLCPQGDQRGSLRDDGSCDIGAFEGEVTLASCLGSNLLVSSTLDAVDASIGDGICDDGSGNCTLRAAIQEANACVGYDVIDVAAGIYPLSLAGNNENATATGDLDITDDMSINGAGAATTIVDGNATVFDDRIFHVINSVTTAFDGLTLQGVDIGWGMLGGGIMTNGDLAVSNSVISNNTAGYGTGIYATGSGIVVDVTASTLSDNNGQKSGAGIFVGDKVRLTVSGSTLSNNTQAYEYGHRGTAIYAGNGAIVTVDQTLIDNNASGYAQSVYGHDNSTITIRSSTVSNSQAGTRGVTGWIGSTVNIIDSTITGNLAGGIYTREAASVLNITDSTISNNEAHAAGSYSANGAGASIGGAFTITGSTFSGNRIINDGLGGSGSGAGLHIAGTGSIVNSTISGNYNGGQNSRGGGIGGPGTLTLLNSTVDGNTAPYGGNIGLQNGTLIIANSILANGVCDITYTTVTSGGYNIDSGNTCDLNHLTDQINTDPLLDPLTDNGGLTQTHALQVGSPAIDAGDDAVCAAAPVNGFDQRGIVRPQGNQCDVGAYEAVVNSPG